MWIVTLNAHSLKTHSCSMATLTSLVTASAAWLQDDSVLWIETSMLIANQQRGCGGPVASLVTSMVAVSLAVNACVSLSAGPVKPFSVDLDPFGSRRL